MNAPLPLLAAGALDRLVGRKALPATHLAGLAVDGAAPEKRLCGVSLRCSVVDDPALATCRKCQRIAAKPPLKERLRRKAQRERDSAKKRRRCGMCRSKPARMGKRSCAGCVRRTTENERAKKAERRAANLCITCGLLPPVTPGGRCQGCDDRRKALPSYGKNATRAFRKAHDLCQDCGGEKDRYELTRCAGCREAMALKQKARADGFRAAKKCITCGRKKPVKGKSKCRTCRAKHRGRDDEQ